jgi:hypothetical protein
MKRVKYLLLVGLVLTLNGHFGCETEPTTPLSSDGDADGDAGSDGDADGDTDGDTYDPLGLEGDGPYTAKKVTEQGFKINGRAALISMPTENDEIAAGDGPFPVVIIHPYSVGAPSEYKHFYEHIVSHGFIAVGINYPPNNFFAGGMDQLEGATHTVHIIDWLFSDDNPWKAHFDANHIVTAGHSVGGKIAVYAATLDDRITDVIAWDPVDTGGPPCGLDQIMPNADPPYSELCARWPVGRSAEQMSTLKANLLIFGGNTGGELSCNPEGFSHHDYVRNIPESLTSLHIIFSESEHLDWQGIGSNPVSTIAAVVCDASSKPAVTKLVHRVAKRTNVAWLLKFTKNVAQADEYLEPNGPVMAPDVNTGAISPQWN